MATVLNLSPELAERVRKLAAAERRSQQQLLIRAVEEYVDRHERTERAKAFGAQFAADNAELMERLR